MESSSFRETFRWIARIQPGDLLVSNFNNVGNLQGRNDDCSHYSHWVRFALLSIESSSRADYRARMPEDRVRHCG